MSRLDEGTKKRFLYLFVFYHIFISTFLHIILQIFSLQNSLLFRFIGSHPRTKVFSTVYLSYDICVTEGHKELCVSTSVTT